MSSYNAANFNQTGAIPKIAGSRQGRSGSLQSSTSTVPSSSGCSGESSSIDDSPVLETILTVPTGAMENVSWVSYIEESASRGNLSSIFALPDKETTTCFQKGDYVGLFLPVFLQNQRSWKYFGTGQIHKIVDDQKFILTTRIVLEFCTGHVFYMEYSASMVLQTNFEWSLGASTGEARYISKRFRSHYINLCLLMMENGQHLRYYKAINEAEKHIRWMQQVEAEKQSGVPEEELTKAPVAELNFVKSLMNEIKECIDSTTAADGFVDVCRKKVVLSWQAMSKFPVDANLKDEVLIREQALMILLEKDNTLQLSRVAEFTRIIQKATEEVRMKKLIRSD